MILSYRGTSARIGADALATPDAALIVAGVGIGHRANVHGYTFGDRVRPGMVAEVRETSP